MGELLDGSFVGKSKMIVDATVPWRYKYLKGTSEFPLFKRASFLEVDPRDDVCPEDYSRWIKEAAGSEVSLFSVPSRSPEASATPWLDGP